MGASGSVETDEFPIHQVYVSSFLIDAYEVTNRQYSRFVAATGHRPAKFAHMARLNHPDQPVVGVSWDDAHDFCNWASKRLPTEAEWEKACRGGLEGRVYPWGSENPSGRARFGAPYEVGGSTLRVGSYLPNGFGLYDIAGNAAEWCSDWYASDYYSRSPVKDPLGPSGGDHHVVRGCAYVVPTQLPWPCSNRSGMRSYPSLYIGFRGARSVVR